MEKANGPFQLPPLPWAENALDPVISANTISFHYGKHHAAYVTNLNKALESAPDLANKTVEELLAKNCAIVPEAIRTAVRNNAGGHANHSMFWQIMAPYAGGAPTGAIAGTLRMSSKAHRAFRPRRSSPHPSPQSGRRCPGANETGA